MRTSARGEFFSPPRDGIAFLRALHSTAGFPPRRLPRTLEEDLIIKTRDFQASSGISIQISRN